MKHRARVVVITGATAGVGRATAREFARRGARIGLIARGVEGLEATREELELLGGRVLAISADVSNAGEVEAAADRIEEALGPIDVWVNNAMVSVLSPVAEMSADEYRRVTEVTYLGTVHGTLTALSTMRKRGKGTIIQVGSALAYRSIPLQSAYCAAKHAVKGFTESLRTELLHDRSSIRLTMVHLSAMNTPQFQWVKSRLPRQSRPVPPIFQPEVAARAIFWASRHSRREVYVGYPAVKAIIANKFFPGFIDRRLSKTGYESQQTENREVVGRRDNLYAPVEGNFGARGEFDESKHNSTQWWIDSHRGIFIGLAILAGGAAIGWRAMQSK